MFSSYPDLVSVEQIMTMLNIGKSKAYKLIQSNAIRHIRIGATIRVPKQYLIDFIEQLCYNGIAVNPSS